MPARHLLLLGRLRGSSVVRVAIGTILYCGVDGMRAVVGPARASRLWTRYSVVREPTGGDNGSDLRGALPTALPLFSDSRLFFFLRLLHWHVRTIVSLSLSRFACIFLVPPLCLRVFSCLEILYLV